MSKGILIEKKTKKFYNKLDKFRNSNLGDLNEVEKKQVLYFKNATATFSSFTKEPEVVKF